MGDIVDFEPKKLLDKVKKKYYGSISISPDYKVKVEMEDKVMVLEGSTAFDFAVLMLVAAKYVITKETMKVEEIE